MQAIFLKLLCKLMFCANVKEINEIIFIGFVCSVNVTKYSIYGLGRKSPLQETLGYLQKASCQQIPSILCLQKNWRI